MNTPVSEASGLTVKQKWGSITIVGCGLMGASFALAMKSAGACTKVAGWDKSSSALDEAMRRGAIDEVDYAFAREDVSSSDLIYLAMPVEEIIDFLGKRGRQVKAGATITDAGSTKVKICRTASINLPRDRHFVGGHPVAGSHLCGPMHARADLFNDSPYVLIEQEDEEARSSLVALKETLGHLGARVTLMSAREHDRAMSLVSHLPQIVSSALARVVREQPDRDALLNLSGAGFRDMTRLAASSWSVWRDVLATNSKEIAASLDSLIRGLSAVRDELSECAGGCGEKLKATGDLFSDSRLS
ncbi:MAG: prephenate dehydrogenase/arogenate dehydrogenase family protein [Acidobacteriota bacterium]|nr:prephenate dehydrogenase/arogenate dehydrogenase family protein [Acidobacteriota bacterium]